MSRRGPKITHAELDLHTVQVYADGDPLVEIRRDPRRRVWLLPYPSADNDEWQFPTVARAIKQIEWDGEQLSHAKFAQTYPRYVACEARQVDETTWRVERAGTLLATVTRDPDTLRWLILGLDDLRERVPAAPGGWNFPESAVEHVLNNLESFGIAADAWAEITR